MKGEVLAHVMIVATILAENSDPFVDFITCEGVTCNRRMWKILGIKGKAVNIK